jgi:hypothetical protein
MLKKIFLLEISFEFTLWYPLLIKVLGFLKLIPPHGFPSLQVVGWNYSFYSRWVIIHLEILLHLKHPGLNLFSFLVILFSFLVITIESRRFNLLEITFQDVSLRSSPFHLDNIHTWDSPWTRNFMIYSDGFPWIMMVPSHASSFPIISMIIYFSLGSRCWHLSSIAFFLGVRVLVDFILKHFRIWSISSWAFIILSLSAL